MGTTRGNDGRLTFGFDFQPRAGGTPTGRRSGDDPFRILLLADLSGRAQRNIQDARDLGSRPCLRVDVDDYESAMRTYAPRIDWPMGQILFKELDDFHPDQLYRQLDVFKSLRDMRAKLNDPNTFRETAQQLRTEGRVDQPPADRQADTAPDEDVFGRLLGAPSERSDPPRDVPSSDALTTMIHRLVAPYIVPAADPQRDQYIASVDMAIGEHMRAILHHRDFQSLEATWRGIWELVTSLELDENLELVILDVTKKEILDDLRTHMADLTTSGLHRHWVDKAIGAPDARPWSVIVGHYDFEHSEEDIGLLAGLGLLASHARAPFLADAHPSLLGCPSLAHPLAPETWVADLPLFNELRTSMVSPWIGLAIPRVLMRQPYGQRSDEIDTFPFEELGAAPDHEQFLWGSSAVACAKLLGMAFQEQGWSMVPEAYLDLEDLPAYTVDTKEDKALMPCAEQWMSDRISDEVARRGLIAFMSYRHRNAVRVRTLQSIAEPPTALSGPWV